MIYLMRHPHIKSQGKMIGSLDFPLSDLGCAQAGFWHNKLQNTVFHAVYSSQLTRTVECAHIIKPHTPIIKKNAFNEIHLGDWEGQEKTHIKSKYADLWALRGKNLDCVAPPNGESFTNLSDRVFPLFLSLLKKHNKENILIIAHQAVNRVILANLQKIHLKDIQNIPQDYACLNIITTKQEQNIVTNIDYHLCPIIKI